MTSLVAPSDFLVVPSTIELVVHFSTGAQSDLLPWSPSTGQSVHFSTGPRVASLVVLLQGIKLNLKPFFYRQRRPFWIGIGPRCTPNGDLPMILDVVKRRKLHLRETAFDALMPNNLFSILCSGKHQQSSSEERAPT